MSYNLVAVVQNLSYAIIFDRNNIEIPTTGKKVLNIADFKNHVRNLLLDRINIKVSNYQIKNDLINELSSKLKLIDTVEPWDTVAWQLIENSEHGAIIKLAKFKQKYIPV